MPSGQRTIRDVIKSTLPNGTQDGDAGWDKVCVWPPDLFAVVATITELSGLYSEQTFVAYWLKPGFELSATWLDDVCKIGRNWAQSGLPPHEVKSLWRKLFMTHGSAPLVDQSAAALEWKKIVFRLIAIADEASAGIGFPPHPAHASAGPSEGEAPAVRSAAAKPAESKVKGAFYSDHITWQEFRRQHLERVGGEVLPYLPHSLCMRVPPEIVCVQPKCSTPAVGCTLRSMTHHLALLPPIGNVTTHWYIAGRAERGLGPFNILVVPYPYSLPGGSFRAGADSFPAPTSDKTFSLDPPPCVNGVTEDQFTDYLCDLIKAAKPEVETVHAIVLPETALGLQFASNVAQKLAPREPKLDFFVTGAVSGAGAELRNNAAMFRFGDGEAIIPSFQSKHHRWRLEGDQIRRYHLGHVLDPNKKWWEQIDVSYRNCYVMQFRPGASLSVLVCEDLARYDPVLTVMNAIGPNLVVALLMDGPQLEKRWPGRYATVLAEDPGSAVLTVTSLGMVMRSAMPGENQNRTIALWKEPNGKAQELALPKGDHALLLSLTTKLVEQVTLDGRSDGKSTVNFALGAARGIKYLGKPLAWLGPVP